MVAGTDAVLTQGQLIGVLQEHARPGDVVIAAAGGPPGDLLKVWDATGGRHCHLEFGFSCMGYEIPAAIGVRLAEPVTPGPAARVVSFLGDGTFLLAPTELVTAAAEGLAVTLVVPDNHGYQVIHRLQMLRSGREFGNEFRYRPEPLQLAAGEATKAPRLEGDYLRLDLVQVAAGLGARACRVDDRGRTAGRAVRHARSPRPGGDRGAGHPARRPARRRGLVGRRPGRGVHRGGHQRPARRVRIRLQGPAVVRMSASPPNRSLSPLNRGALAAAVRSGIATLGTFIGAASPLTAEVCAAAGVDWVLLDLEHGGGGEEQVRDVVPAAGSYGVPTVVRVESAARIRMGRVLDSGAAGIMLPRLDTADEVAEAIRHLRYPPAGDRGVATYNRACRFGLDPGALDRANDEILGVVQIESAAAVGQRGQIAGLDGVDVLFVGPRDLSHDLGVPGDTAAPPFTEAIEHGQGGQPPLRQGLRPAGDRRRRRGPAARAGLVVRGHRLGMPPCWPPRSPPSSAAPAPDPGSTRANQGHQDEQLPATDTPSPASA